MFVAQIQISNVNRALLREFFFQRKSSFNEDDCERFNASRIHLYTVTTNNHHLPSCLHAIMPESKIEKILKLTRNEETNKYE